MHYQPLTKNQLEMLSHYQSLKGYKTFWSVQGFMLVKMEHTGEAGHPDGFTLELFDGSAKHICSVISYSVDARTLVTVKNIL